MFKSFSHSNWTRFDQENVTMIWHHEPINAKTTKPSHRHNDICSFVLYINGQPILVDTGRPTYNLNDPFGNYGVSAKSHNSVIIDDFEPQVGVRTQRFPVFYSKTNLKIKITEKDNYHRIEFIHDGFSRLRTDKIIFSRSFEIYENYIIIKDSFKGSKEHITSTFLHWYPNLIININKSDSTLVEFRNLDSSVAGTLKCSGYNNISHNPDFLLYQGETKDGIAGWYSNEYGKKIECFTLQIKEKMFFPATRQYRIEWKA